MTTINSTENDTKVLTETTVSLCEGSIIDDLENNAEAGPSNDVDNDSRASSLELAADVKVYPSNTLEDIFDNSILLSNDISMARDQLANERNWLTWFKMSCTLIILGFSILLRIRLPEADKKIDFIDESNQPIGYTFISIGFLCLILCIANYFKNQKLLIKQATYIQAGWSNYIAISIIFLFVCILLILASTSIKLS